MCPAPGLVLHGAGHGGGEEVVDRQIGAGRDCRHNVHGRADRDDGFHGRHTAENGGIEAGRLLVVERRLLEVFNERTDGDGLLAILHFFDGLRPWWYN